MASELAIRSFVLRGFVVLATFVSTAAQAAPLWPDGQHYNAQFKKVESDCRPGLRLGEATPVYLGRDGDTQIIAMPEAEPEQFGYSAIFRNTNGGSFQAGSVESYPMETYGKMTISQQIVASAPSESGGTLGTLTVEVQTALSDTVPAEAVTRANDLKNWNCSASYEIVLTPVQADPIDLKDLQRDWDLLVETTKFTTAKDPKSALIPIEKALAQPCEHRVEFLWRKARAWFLLGEQMPLDDKEGRLAAFTKGQDAADAALSVDPQHGSALMFKGANLGRFNTTKGALKMMFGLDDVEEVLQAVVDAGSDYNILGFPTLGEAHNALAQFYRLVPDSGFAKMLLGVRGDIQKSIQHNREAVKLQPDRGEFQKELGVALLCGWDRDDNDSFKKEGLMWLQRSQKSVTWAFEDPNIDLRHIQRLLQDPDDACKYSRDSYDD